MARLSDLGLNISQPVYVHGLKFGPERTVARLIGYAEHQGFIITPPERAGDRLEIVEGDSVSCCVFLGRYAYTFAASVLQVVGGPPAHVILSYPERVEAAEVRRLS